MLTASDAFADALLASHQAMTRAVLLLPDADPGTYVDEAELTVVSGSLKIDGTRNIWRSATMTLTAADSIDQSALTSADSTARVRVERGIRFPDGTVEWLTIGLFQVQDAKLTLTEAGVQMTANDLGSLVEDYALVVPYVPSGTCVEAIEDLVQQSIVWDTIPSWTVDSAVDSAAVPVAGSVFKGKRWAAVQKLAEAVGAIVRTQPDGSWRLQSALIDTGSPVLTVSTGFGGVLVDATTSKSRREQFNGVPLKWDTVEQGGMVLVTDDDPASPTYWDGPFGRKPRPEESNDLIVDETQATAAATALLDQYRGRVSSLSFTQVHDPRLEPFDVINVRMGATTETHVVDAISYPLTGGTMSVETRLVQEVA